MVVHAIHLGVGAGAATFKAVAFASLARRAGLDVHVTMTQAACAFVAPLSFTAVTNGPVVTDTTAVDAHGVGAHLAPAHTAALVLLPATADLIAHVAHGFGSDAVSLAAISAPKLRFFCPAMNDRMWDNPIVQDNVARLHTFGWRQIGPEVGRLAEGYEAAGRLTEPDEVLRIVMAALDESSDGGDR